MMKAQAGEIASLESKLKKLTRQDSQNGYNDTDNSRKFRENKKQSSYHRDSNRYHHRDINRDNQYRMDEGRYRESAERECIQKSKEDYNAYEDRGGYDYKYRGGYDYNQNNHYDEHIQKQATRHRAIEDRLYHAPNRMSTVAATKELIGKSPYSIFESWNMF